MSVDVFNCRDCGVNTGGIGEYYRVLDEIWEAAGMASVRLKLQRGCRNVNYSEECHCDDCDKGMLCIGCLETRLGRQLTKDEIRPIGVSQRILDRLGVTEPLLSVEQQIKELKFRAELERKRMYG